MLSYLTLLSVVILILCERITCEVSEKCYRSFKEYTSKVYSKVYCNEPEIKSLRVLHSSSKDFKEVVKKIYKVIDNRFWFQNVKQETHCTDSELKKAEKKLHKLFFTMTDKDEHIFKKFVSSEKEIHEELEKKTITIEECNTQLKELFSVNVESLEKSSSDGDKVTTPAPKLQEKTTVAEQPSTTPMPTEGVEGDENNDEFEELLSGDEKGDKQKHVVEKAKESLVNVEPISSPNGEVEVEVNEEDDD